MLVQPGVKDLEATVRWGDYVFAGGRSGHEEEDNSDTPPEEPSGQGEDKRRGYRRIRREERVTLALPKPGEKPKPEPVPDSDGLVLVASSRTLPPQPRLPQGALAVSVFS